MVLYFARWEYKTTELQTSVDDLKSLARSAVTQEQMERYLQAGDREHKRIFKIIGHEEDYEQMPR